MTEYRGKNQTGLQHTGIMSVAAVTVQKVLDIDATWKISNTGAVSVVMEVKKGQRVSRASKV